MMSVMLSVRVSDELAEQVDGAGKRSEVVVRALEWYFGLESKVVRATAPVVGSIYARPAHLAGCGCGMCKPGVK